MLLDQIFVRFPQRLLRFLDSLLFRFHHFVHFVVVLQGKDPLANRFARLGYNANCLWVKVGVTGDLLEAVEGAVGKMVLVVINEVPKKAFIHQQNFRVLPVNRLVEKDADCRHHLLH